MKIKCDFSELRAHEHKARQQTAWNRDRASQTGIVRQVANVVLRYVHCVYDENRSLNSGQRIFKNICYLFFVWNAGFCDFAVEDEFRDFVRFSSKTNLLGFNVDMTDQRRCRLTACIDVGYRRKWLLRTSRMDKPFIFVYDIAIFFLFATKLCIY